VITAPNGFCIDQGTAKKVTNAVTIFAVNCITIQTEIGFSSARRPISAILTATISKSESYNSNDLDGLAEFLSREPGLKMLSRSETINNLKVHDILRDKDILLFFSEQRAENIEVSRSPFFWRALFFIDD
jgi:hypothetical protein